MRSLDQPATAHRLRHLYRAGVLDADAYERALAYAGITPNSADWRRFLDWLLTGLGTALVLCGIVFFFAYNWAGMHRFAKFAALEVTLLIAMTLAWRLGLDSHGGRAALLGAAMLSGVLLALYGQTYQTGADDYALFLTWGLLILPWVIIGRSAALWLLLLVLANLSFELWWAGVYRPEWLFFMPGVLGWLRPGVGFLDADMALLVVALNFVALVAYELMAKRAAWLSGRWMPRLIALAILGSLTPPVFYAIFEPDLTLLSVRLAPVIWLALTALGVWVYRTWRRDLFMLAALALEAIVIVIAFVSKQMLFEGAGGMLNLTLLALLMFGAAAWWLRQTARAWRGEA